MKIVPELVQVFPFFPTLLLIFNNREWSRVRSSLILIFADFNILLLEFTVFLANALYNFTNIISLADKQIQYQTSLRLITF